MDIETQGACVCQHH